MTPLLFVAGMAALITAQQAGLAILALVRGTCCAGRAAFGAILGAGVTALLIGMSSQ